MTAHHPLDYPYCCSHISPHLQPLLLHTLSRYHYRCIGHQAAMALEAHFLLRLCGFGAKVLVHAHVCACEFRWHRAHCQLQHVRTAFPSRSPSLRLLLPLFAFALLLTARQTLVEVTVSEMERMGVMTTEATVPSPQLQPLSLPGCQCTRACIVAY